MFEEIVGAHYVEKIRLVVKPFLIPGETSMCSPKWLKVNKATGEYSDVTRSIFVKNSTLGNYPESLFLAIIYPNFNFSFFFSFWFSNFYL